MVFGAVSFFTVLWLGFIKVDETKSDNVATLKSAFELLKNPFIRGMVLCIFLVVGIDVGFNAFSGQFFLTKLDIKQELAESARSIYFFGRMAGAFLGAILLARISSKRFLIGTTISALFFLLIILLMPSATSALVVTFIVGLTVANIFPLVFSITVQNYSDRSSEISGLMMMAISGGAVIPLLMGLISDFSSVVGGMLVLAVCTFLILFFALKVQKTE